ncbi:MAG: hypothetical protein WD740_03560 [Anaerolineales bacterium]
MPNLRLEKRTSPHGRVEKLHGGWRLALDPGPAGSYRLAQLDDYLNLSRNAFPHRAPFTLSLRARASNTSLPGTWGFGLWNDPFGFSLGFGGTRGRLPALPNSAWFFFASPENHLSLRADQPGNGALAGSFRAAHLPSLLFAPAALALPLLLVPAASRVFRSLAASLFQHRWSQLSLSSSEWHDYAIDWQTHLVSFRVDGVLICETPAPRPPLGLVLWLDNQFAAWQPDGRIGHGTLATPPDCWVELSDIHLGSD